MGAMENKNNTPSRPQNDREGSPFPAFNSQNRRVRPTPPPATPPPATPAPATPKPATTKPQAAKNKPTKPPHPTKDGEREAKRRAEAAKKERQRQARQQRKKEEQQRRARENEMRSKESRQRAEERRGRLVFFIDSHKSIMRNALAYFALFLCVLIIISTLSATVLLLSLLGGSESAELPSTITIETGGEKKRYAYEDVVKDGIYYIDMTAIAELSKLTVSGDSSNLVFTSKSGDRLVFDIPSRYAKVNGISVMLKSEVLIQKGHLWVPYNFVRDYLLGLSLTLEEYTDSYGDPQIKITASRIEAEDNSGFVPVTLLFKPNDTLGQLSDSSLPEQPITLPEGVPDYEFVNDLSSFYKYMSPQDPDKYLIVANPSSALAEDYVPEDMIPVLNAYSQSTTLLLCRDAAKSLEALFVELYTAGYRNVTVTTAYRKYETQKFQFENFRFSEIYYYNYNYAQTGKWFSDEAYEVLGSSYINDVYISKNKTQLSIADAERVVRSYCAYPGTSDHQTALGVNLYLPTSSGEAFSESEVYTWLVDNAHKFGFILRYPDGKESITGYPFEPSHLRFVGQYHAARIHSSGLTLEEYVAKYIE